VLVSDWREMAAGRSVRIAFSEPNDERVLRTLPRLVATAAVIPRLVGDEVVIRRVARQAGVRMPAEVEFFAPPSGSDPLRVAAQLLHDGLVQAAVNGCTRSTADVIRVGINEVGLAPGVRTVSSCTLMLLNSGEPLAFADCAVVPEPTAEQLVDIAVATAKTFAALTKRAPRIALLSYSTHGSATHPSLDRLRQAVTMLHAAHPDLIVDGELQVDAALVPEVAASKAPSSRIAGDANVLIFPDLNAGNIAYKLVARLAGTATVGPLVQGLALPWHDLSRGCSSTEIELVAMAAAAHALTLSAGHCADVTS
jgi:Phosphotransacetylase